MTILLGAHSQALVGRRGNSTPAAMDKLEQILWGPTPTRRFGAERLYYQWGDRTSFPDGRFNDAIANGRVPVMSIEPPNDLYVNITAGNHDSQIADWGDRLAALSLPRGTGYLAFKSEADLIGARTRYGSGGNTHQIVGPQYVAAFRHIIDIWRAHGVATAGWNMGSIFTVGGYPPSVIQYWYLGDSYCNATDGFLGVDGYNWYPCKPGSHWREWTEVMAPFWNFAAPKKTANGCRLVVAETACQERDAFDEYANAYECPGFQGQSTTGKRDWINNMRDACKTTHSALDVLCWFDSETIYNWWLDTRANTTTAFANMGLDPFFGGGSSNDNIVTVPLASATASAVVPTVSLPGSVRVDAPIATATATAYTPTVSGNGNIVPPSGVVQLLVGA